MYFLRDIACAAIGFGVAMLILARAKPSRPPLLTKTWTLRRVHGRTVINMDVGVNSGVHSGPSFFMEIRLPAELGDTVWKSYLGWVDWMADSTQGKVKLVDLGRVPSKDEVSNE